MIHPHSRFNIFRETLVLILTLVITIEVPVVLVFNIHLHGLLAVLDIIISLVFAADIILNFLTGYEQDNRVVMDFSRIAKRYLKKWFWIDLVATVPFGLIFQGLPFLQAGRLPKLLRLLRLTRLLRLLRIAQFILRINSTNILKPGTLRLISLVFWITYAVHFIACGWIVLGGNPNGLDNLSLYIRALYWTVTTVTTIGYGDIIPHTNEQTLYVIVIEIIGAGMYGFIIANIANLITNIDVAKSQYRDKIEKINIFMKYKNIPADLQKNVNDYYSYLWESRRGYVEASVLQDLPISLKTRISLFINRDMVAKVPIFQGASDEFIREILLNLEATVFTPGDIIVRKGEIGFDMFFISKGSVDVVSEDGSIIYATLASAQFFGEIALLFSTPRTATIRAREYCDLYRLDKEIFDSVLERYPDFEAKIRDYARQRKAELNS